VYRPVTEEPVPGETYQLDVELWPTCVVLPAGSRLAGTRETDR